MIRHAVIAAMGAFALGWLSATPALAHPHVFVQARAEVLYQPDGKVLGLRHVWSFDEAYSVYITQGLDKNGDGKLSEDELAELAKVNMESLPEVGFFTIAKANGKAQEFATPREARLNYENKVLTLTFVLPFKQPVSANRYFALEIGDPTYFVAFDIAAGDDAVVARDAPKGCVVRIARPPKLDDATQKRLAEADVTAMPDTSGLEVTTRALVACP